MGSSPGPSHMHIPSALPLPPAERGTHTAAYPSGQAAGGNESQTLKDYVGHGPGIRQNTEQHDPETTQTL